MPVSHNLNRLSLKLGLVVRLGAVLVASESESKSSSSSSSESESESIIMMLRLSVITPSSSCGIMIAGLPHACETPTRLCSGKTSRIARLCPKPRSAWRCPSSFPLGKHWLMCQAQVAPSQSRLGVTALALALTTSRLQRLLALELQVQVQAHRLAARPGTVTVTRRLRLRVGTGVTL